MNGDLREIVVVTLRMYVRNRMALAFSYVFPVLFLLAFLVLYKDDEPDRKSTRLNSSHT